MPVNNAMLRNMNVLMWISLLWILYQYRSKVDWISVQHFLCLPDVNRVFLLNTARIATRVFCFLYIVWHIFSYYRGRMQYKVLVGEIAYFMTYYKIPTHIQARVLQYYHQEWSNNKIKFPISRFVLKMLPTELFTAVTEQVGATIMEKLQIYQDCFRFFVSIAPKVKTQYYSSGDLVCRKGTWADKMYLIADGILEATSDSGQYLDTMSSGDVFGEIGVLHIDGNYLRTANVRSVGDSELFALKEHDVNEIIKDFPEAKKVLTALGKKRLLKSSKVVPQSSVDDTIE